MRRYGFAAEAAAAARGISGAASHFLLNQLPELYGGLQRDPMSFPVQYLGANVPQAWAAGTPFMLLQAMLGLRQDAPRDKLYVDPALPDWLPDVTLTDLRLGRRRFDIRFWRDGKDTDFKVLKGKPNAVEWMSIALSGSAGEGGGQFRYLRRSVRYRCLLSTLEVWAIGILKLSLEAPEQRTIRCGHFPDPEI
jgi:hypothetical protein